MLRWIIFILIFCIFSIYGYQAIKTVTKASWLHYLFIAIALIIASNFIYQFSISTEGRVLNPAKSYALGFLLAFMSLNLVIVPILLGEDIIRSVLALYDKLVTKEVFDMPSRRKFISQIALGYQIIMWDVLSFDWEQDVSEEKCLENVISKSKAGSIIVFHDSVKASKNMTYALPKVLEIFSKKGYVFKSLS